MDGRRLDGYTISSPCEPKGSGELILYIAIKESPRIHATIPWFHQNSTNNKRSKVPKSVEIQSYMHNIYSYEFLQT